MIRYKQRARKALTDPSTTVLRVPRVTCGAVAVVNWLRFRAEALLDGVLLVMNGDRWAEWIIGWVDGAEAVTVEVGVDERSVAANTLGQAVLLRWHALRKDWARVERVDAVRVHDREAHAHSRVADCSYVSIGYFQAEVVR